jgi:filamentous hemagglutinin family protein
VVKAISISPLFQISICTLGSLYLSSDISLAQVTQDETLNTQVNQNGNVAEITGGQTRGGNLFHSFRDFSVSSGNEAFFNNATDISNIFSRVTGGNISNIDGLIRSNGSANLFLINPAGILFGQNARLDVGGSFLGSTADSILFEDGEFSATDLNNPPVLTINAPIGLNLRDQPADIVNRSFAANNEGENVGLEVSPGNNLAFVGGNITFDRGGILTARGGNIELGGLSAAGTVGINPDGSLSFPETVARADVSLNGSYVDVTGTGGGNITVNARNLKLEAGEFDGSIISSFLQAGITADSTSAEAQAGDITINATGIVTLDGGSIFNFVDSDAIGNGGNINIEARSLSVTNTGQIIATTLGKGDTGSVNIVVEEKVSFDGRDEMDSFPSGIFVNVREGAIGNAGDINITTGSLQITNRAQLSSTTEGMGDAGNIYIDAQDEVSLSNSILISEITEGTGMGDGGDITIKTGSLLLQNGSALLADTENQGDAGNINIEARERITMEGQGLSAFANATEIVPNQITSTTDPRNVEIDIGSKGGNISISTGSVEIADDGFIKTSTFGKGDAGNLTISASQGIQMVGGGLIDAGVEEGSTGNGGNLNINTNKLSLNNSQISTSTSGKGNAGNLTVNASESIELSGEFLDENGNPIGPGGLLAQTDLNATGKGGNLTVETKRLSISNGSKIQAATFNNGDAGEIEIRASEINLFNTPNANNQFPTEINAGSVRDKLGRNANSLLKGNGGSATIETERLTISNGARINVRSDGQGKSGNLNIQTGNLDLSDDAQISAATAFGEGGNINLKIDDSLTMRNNSLISAQALNNADGGNINIDTNFIVAFPNQINGNGSDIIASAAEGDGGRISINAESLLGIQERKAEDNNQTNDIDASSEFGLDGTVSIFTPDINPVQGATELPSNVVEAEQTTEQACQANREAAAKNGLIVRGKGGIPATPDQPLTSQNITINGEITPAYAIPEPIETSQGKIHLARGIKVTKDGQVILTPYPTNNAGERIPEIKPNCI